MNRPLLLRQLDALREAGISEIALVGDETVARAVQASPGMADQPALNLSFIPSCPETGPAERLLAAEPFLSTADRFVVQPGHMLVEHDVRGSVERLKSLHAVVVDARAPRTTGMAAEPRALHPAGVPTPAAALALVISDGEIFSAIRGVGSDIDLMQAVLALAERSGGVETQAVSGWSMEIESAEDLLDANDRLLDELEPGYEPGSLSESKVLGPVAIDPAARVECSLVRGPVVIGARARVADAYIGPYTCIGEAAVIERGEVESCVILPGASLENLPARLERSVIGENARISRQLGPPRALRVAVGAEARLSLP